jgi:predicted DCC family thiol-disulfide oxidoreductase YuxK
MKSFSRFFHEIFSLDLRSLALLRIGVGFCILGDLFWRAQDLRAMMTDFGFLPRAALVEKFMSPWYFSIHLISGSLFFESFLFVLAALLACLLILGYRTRWVSFISWIFLISLHARNPIILQGGDVLLRLLCFWGIFLPWGARYSVDSAFEKDGKASNIYFSFATVGLVAQLIFVYVFAALLKSAPEWHSELSAVSYALHIDQFVTSFGRFLRDFPEILKFLTFLTFWLEAVGWVLWISPWAFERVRLFGVLAFIGMHLAFRLCLDVGPFTWVSIASLTALLPSIFWDSFSKRKSFTIYYDGHCGFCKKMAYLLKTFLILPQAKIKIAQDDSRIEAMMLSNNSWVITTADGKNLFCFEAAVYAADQSPLRLGKLFHFFRGVGDWTYKWVANHRHWMTWITRPIHARPYHFKDFKFQKPCLIFLIFYCLWWNLGTINSSLRMPLAFQSIGSALRLDQNWNMFSPFPLKEDGWFVIVGKLNGGGEIDLFRDGAPLTFERPVDIAAMYKTERWRKYMMNLWLKKNAAYRIYLAQYLCREWNTRQNLATPVTSLQIIFNLENIHSQGVRDSPEKVVLLDYGCFSALPEKTH